MYIINYCLLCRDNFVMIDYHTYIGFILTYKSDVEFNAGIYVYTTHVHLHVEREQTYSILIFFFLHFAYEIGFTAKKGIISRCCVMNINLLTD